MDSAANGGTQPHFVLLPFPAQGHLIPMVDFARLLAKRSVFVTILVTPQNASRFKSVIDLSTASGLCIRAVHLKLACIEHGLTEGCENLDMLESPKYFINLMNAIGKLRDQVEDLLQHLQPRPSCLAIDLSFPWDPNRPLKYQIPRLVFYPASCFTLLHPDMLGVSRREHSESLTDCPAFKVRDGLPPTLVKLLKDMYGCEETAFGTVTNTIEELETEWVEKYRGARGRNVWCIGPVSLCNEDDSDKGERGKKAAIDLDHCLKWLDSHEPSSIIYICFGSTPNIPTSQLIELGLGLESSNHPFIWVVRNATDELKAWFLEVKFEERTRGRGLLIHGWAPQVLILSHPSVGGFMTHCGWNSVLEGLTAGVSMVTWPLFGDQFCNEELIVDVVKTGIRAGDEGPSAGVQVKSDDVKIVIDKLMDGEEEGRERRERARKIREIAKGAVEEQGSSYNNMTQLIREVIKQQAKQVD